jgi:hypothetical protein
MKPEGLNAHACREIEFALGRALQVLVEEFRVKVLGDDRAGQTDEVCSVCFLFPAGDVTAHRAKRSHCHAGGAITHFRTIFFEGASFKEIHDVSPTHAKTNARQPSATIRQGGIVEIVSFIG